MIKAAFFDIDGTLVSLKTKVYPPSAARAVARLREKGILCYVATGRSRFEIASEHLLDGMEFDGFLTNNGQDAYTPGGQQLYGKPLAREDARAAIRWAREGHYPCWVVTARESILSFCDRRVEKAMEAIHTAVPRLGDPCALEEEPIYKIVLFVTPEEISQVLALTPHSRKAQWFELGHDLISREGGKRAAMEEILRLRGIDPEDTIAFGDGENDLEMLEAAGIGVAMGNGSRAAREAADYVTEDCDRDGLWKALEHFGLL